MEASQSQQSQQQQSLSDVNQLVDELKQRVLYENLSQVVTKCTRSCVKTYESMYLDDQEESCVKSCYQKSLEFQGFLNQELAFLIRNL